MWTPEHHLHINIFISPARGIEWLQHWFGTGPHAILTCTMPLWPPTVRGTAAQPIQWMVPATAPMHSWLAWSAAVHRRLRRGHRLKSALRPLHFHDCWAFQRSGLHWSENEKYGICWQWDKMYFTKYTGSRPTIHTSTEIKPVQESLFLPQAWALYEYIYDYDIQT